MRWAGCVSGCLCAVLSIWWIIYTTYMRAKGGRSFIITGGSGEAPKIKYTKETVSDS